jgi:hypothetical protein
MDHHRDMGRVICPDRESVTVAGLMAIAIGSVE